MSVLIPWPINSLPPLRPGDPMRDRALDPAYAWEWQMENSSPPDIADFDAWCAFIDANPDGFMAPDGFTGANFCQSIDGRIVLRAVGSRIDGPNPWDHFRIERSVTGCRSSIRGLLHDLTHTRQSEYRMEQTPSQKEFSRRCDSNRRAITRLHAELGSPVAWGEYSFEPGTAGFWRHLLDTIDALSSFSHTGEWVRDMLPRECQWLRDLRVLYLRLSARDAESVLQCLDTIFGEAVTSAFHERLASSVKWTDEDCARIFNRGVLVTS